MAPPQTAVKKTVVRTRVHRAVQPGKGVEKVAEEEMEEVETDEGLADSEASEDLDVSRAIQNMVKNTRAKRTSQRNAIFKAHDDRVKKTHHNIMTLFEKHEKSAATIRGQHNKRLAVLLNTKANLEAELSARLIKLRCAYLAHSQDVQSALEARARALEHPTT